MLLITSSFGKPRLCWEEYFQAVSHKTSLFLPQFSWFLLWIGTRAGPHPMQGPKDTHTYFKPKNHQLWKQNIWGTSSQGANCQKKLLSVYVELFSFLVLLCGLARGRDRWMLLPGRQWQQAAEWQNSHTLPSIHEPLPWLCCSVRLHPDISVLVPIDPSLYCWRAQHFSPLIPSAGWVSSTIRASVAPAGITPVPAASLQSSSLTCTLTIFSSGQCYSEEHLFTVRNEVLEGMEGRCSVFIQYQWFHNKKVTASHD